MDALLADDPLFSLHRAGEPHPERPERLVAARRGAAAARGVRWVELEAEDADEDALGRVHRESYLTRLSQQAGQWAHLDPDTFVCPDSVAVARRAAGAAVALTSGLLSGRARFGLGLLRPPGHHARPSAAMGFCLLNNVAVAAAHARSMGVERVMILDFDVHHGNGTQEIFYGDPNVLFVSLHQFPFYPGTGENDEQGSGDGLGYTVNVPLSRGADDAVYAAAFDRIILPILQTYQPGLLLVSAGFDAHAGDPLGGMALSAEGFSSMTRDVARALPAGAPIGMVLEGGYDLEQLQRSITRTVEAITLDGAAKDPSPTLSPVHEEDLRRAQGATGRHWSLG